MLLPLTGAAGIAAPSHPCPADQMDMADMPDMDASCCDEELSARLGYEVCKPGLENCQAPALFVLPPPEDPVLPTGSNLVAAHPPDAVRFNAESFWRPPRL